MVSLKDLIATGGIDEPLFTCSVWKLFSLSRFVWLGDNGTFFHFLSFSRRLYRGLSCLCDMLQKGTEIFMVKLGHAVLIFYLIFTVDLTLWERNLKLLCGFLMAATVTKYFMTLYKLYSRIIVITGRIWPRLFNFVHLTCPLHSWGCGKVWRMIILVSFNQFTTAGGIKLQLSLTLAVY